MPTRKQLSQIWESQMEFPATRRTDDPMYVPPKEITQLITGTPPYFKVGDYAINYDSGYIWQLDETDAAICNAGYAAGKTNVGLYVCDWCGKDVAMLADPDRPHKYICTVCHQQTNFLCALGGDFL